MKKDIRYVNHEKVKLVIDYDKFLFEIREYLSGRAIIALGNTYTEKEIKEELDLMLKTIQKFEDFVNKHICDLNKEFCSSALIAVKDTRAKLHKKQDSALNLINYVLGLSIQLDFLMLEFRDKFYDNLQ